jgi:hypothetical protein
MIARFLGCGTNPREAPTGPSHERIGWSGVG